MRAVPVPIAMREVISNTSSITRLTDTLSTTPAMATDTRMDTRCIR